MGKELARTLLDQAGDRRGLDSSTLALLRRLNAAGAAT